jgi:hypothetical protein
MVHLPIYAVFLKLGPQAQISWMQFRRMIFVTDK